MRVKAESLLNKAVGSAPKPGKSTNVLPRIFPANIYSPLPPTPLIDILLVTDSHLSRLIWPGRGSAPTFPYLIGQAQEGGSE